MAKESVKQRVGDLATPRDQRALLPLITALQKDVAELQAKFNAHVHTANNAVPTVLASELNTTE